MRPATVLALALVLSCDRSPDKPADSDMSVAIDKARTGIQGFIRQLQKPAPSQSSFSVKVKFVEGDKIEHLWLDDLRFDGKLFHGKIDNDPEDLKRVKRGDACSVAPDQISDWMYVENGKLVGGQTIRLLYRSLSAEEKKEYEKAVGYKID